MRRGPGARDAAVRRRRSPRGMRSLCERWARRSRGGTPSTNSAMSSGAATTASKADAWPCSSGTLENVTAASIPSATRLMSVCEKTVPATTGIVRVAGPCRRRLSTTTRVGSPSRPGRPRRPSRRSSWRARWSPAQSLVGQRGGKDGVPGDRAREQREHHQYERQHEPALGSPRPVRGRRAANSAG